MSSRSSDRYRESGVDIEAGESFVDKIRPLIQSTHRPEVQGHFGHYGALFSLEKLGAPQSLLVAATDGVGTKLALARDLGSWESLGQDLVAMCANDILCLGAHPLFFLDYYATAKLELEASTRIVAGIAEACRHIGCALIGGETAEMPGLYRPGDFDLAGFLVGAVAKDQLIDGRAIEVGDIVLGLPSSGFHANGYSLIRKIIADRSLDLGSKVDGLSEDLGTLLTRPTRLYGPVLEKLFGNTALHGLAHITGGGLIGNVPRILPEGCQWLIDRSCWERSPVFAKFQEWGEISDEEMLHVFNDGIGMVLVVAASAADTVKKSLEDEGETAWHLGQITERKGASAAVQVK